MATDPWGMPLVTSDQQEYSMKQPVHYNLQNWQFSLHLGGSRDHDQLK